MTADKPKPTAAMVRAALRKRYDAPAFALLEEVKNATGGYATRSADAVAMGLWPSRGIEIHGIEIKVRRADWLGELKKPQKADEIAKFCDRWLLAAGDDSVVKSGELPPTWGLLVLREDGTLRVAIEAPPLEPEPLSKMFLAALLRRSAHGIEKLRQDANAEGFQRAREQVPQAHRHELDRLQGQLDAAQTRIADFEQASGIDLAQWGPRHIGEQFRRFLDLSKAYDPKPVDSIRRAADFLQRQANELRDLGNRLEDQKDIAQEKANP